MAGSDLRGTLLGRDHREKFAMFRLGHTDEHPGILEPSGVVEAYLTDFLSHYKDLWDVNFILELFLAP